MKEKKLTDEVVAKNAITDEEIIKALGYCTKSRCDDETTGNCPLKNDESCGTILAINALDLIRRLQSGYSSASKASEEWREKYEKERKENEEYNQKLDDGELLSKDYHDEQVFHYVDENAELRTEIEVLKTELQKECQEHLAFAELAKRADKQQKAEIERLTEENEHLDGCAKQFLTDYQNEQVKSDEFEKRYLEESKERCRFEQLYKKICHDHNIGLGVQRKHWEKKVQQAVKDTAKEIYDDIDKSDILVVQTQEYGEIEVVPIERLQEIVKSKGVEVE